MNKKRVIQIVSIVLVVLLVFGVYFLKQYNKDKKYENSGNKDFYFVITEKLDIEKLKTYKIPIIIDFGSEGCMPCLKMAPDLQALNSELKGKAIIKYLDVWENPHLAEDYNFTYVPTQIFIDKEGKPYVPKNIKDVTFDIKKDSNGNHIYTSHTGILTKEQMLKILKEMGLGE